MMKVFVGIVGIFCLIATVWANGEFCIYQSPNGVNFKQSDTLKTSELPNIISFAVGHSATSDDTWNGLSISDPFSYPKLVIMIVVEGLYSLGLGSPRYPLLVTNNLQEIKDDFSSILSNDITPMFDENDIYAGTIPDVQLNKLDSRNEVIAPFLKDLGVLKDLQTDVSSQKLSSVWITLPGLANIVKGYGADSEEVKEASSLLKGAIEGLKETANSAYGNRVLLLGITDDGARLTRAKRSVAQTRNSTFTSKYELNISKAYDSEYASIFNIILWTSIFLLAALISTAIFICTLDPGRDSIIYRMTTQRIKKDN